LRFRSSSLALAVASLFAAAAASCGDHDEPLAGEQLCQLKPTETFHERIEPLLEPSRVTTCNECHLSGVDLSAFARETPCKTWACLVEQGLVNTESPEDSKILAWVERASPQSSLITPQVIQAEHDAFRDWIDANAACPDACAGVTCGQPKDGPTCEVPATNPDAPPTDEDTRGCSDTDLEQAFFDDVYSWRGRCFPCHFDTETKADPAAPRWLSSIGNCQTGSAVSLKRVLSLGLIDTKSPIDSLILQKPLDESGGGVKHGGGQKFDGPEDPTYQSFLRFILHYQQCQQP
jgi:hypothetical protein